MIGWVSKPVIYVLGIALLASLTFGGYQCSQKQVAHTALHKARADHADVLRDIAEKARKAADLAREAEQERAELRNEASEAYEEGKRDAEREGNAVAADLRAGNLKLRKQWAGCVSASGTDGTSSGEPDASADLRAASAGRIIGIAAACDAHVRGLQAVIEADRK